MRAREGQDKRESKSETIKQQRVKQQRVRTAESEKDESENEGECEERAGPSESDNASESDSTGRDYLDECAVGTLADSGR